MVSSILYYQLELLQQFYEIIFSPCSMLQIINWENLSDFPGLADKYLANLLCEPRSPCHQSPSLLLHQGRATHQMLSMP